jgi:hypothetical protein
MRKITLTICAAAAFLLLSCSDNKKEDKTSSETKTTGASNEAWVPVDSAVSMKHMMEYGTPGPMHKMLASWSGTWEGDMTLWSYDGAVPTKSTGTAISTMIMDGKYQTSTHTGSFGGMPFEGRGLTAYDNANKQFVSSWIDNWGTGIMMMTGGWDSASKTLTMTGTMPDLDRPGKECHMKEVFKVIDDNTQHMEMYGPDPKTGKEFKMMEIHSTRKK